MMESDEAAFLSVIPGKSLLIVKSLEPLQSLINNFCVINPWYKCSSKSYFQRDELSNQIYMKLQNVYRAHISLASANTRQTSSRL